MGLIASLRRVHNHCGIHSCPPGKLSLTGLFVDPGLVGSPSVSDGLDPTFLSTPPESPHMQKGSAQRYVSRRAVILPHA
jgi:hypothetical protein